MPASAPSGSTPPPTAPSTPPAGSPPPEAPPSDSSPSSAPSGSTPPPARSSTPQNKPQPGRIEPKQSAGKLSGDPSHAGGAEDISKIAQDPAGAAANAVVNKVAGALAARDAKGRFNKALRNAHKTERAPTLPQYRLGLVEGAIIIGVSAAVDVVDWIAGLFFEIAIGEIIVIIVDIIYAILLACYCRFKLKMHVSSHPLMYLSILGAELLNNVPFVNATWWADAWYIVHTIRAEDRQTHQQLMQTIEQEKQDEARQNFMADFEAKQAQAEQTA